MSFTKFAENSLMKPKPRTESGNMSPGTRLNCKVFFRDKEETARRGTEKRRNRRKPVRHRRRGWFFEANGPRLSLRFHPRRVEAKCTTLCEYRRRQSRWKEGGGVFSGVCFVFAERRSLYCCRAGYYICMYVRYYDTT